MANISVNVVDGNNINLVLTPPQTQTITIDRGVSGSTGPAGAAATIAAGTTTTGAAGSSASVTNSGTSSAAIFDFTIPRGDVGATGNAATIAAGTTTTLAAGSSATVTNAGTSSAAIFNFGIPRGPIGINWLGNWSSATTYAINDGVFDVTSGSSYIAIAASTNQQPPNSSYWNLVAQKGANGSGSGTVSSVALTAPAFLSVSGSPITSTGTIALTYSGTAIPIANGGTASTTAQDAINTLANGVTSGSYLRGNGTNVLLSTIQAADVPTLNQNTTGTAAGLSTTLAITSGGTGLTTTPANGALDIGNGTGFTRTTLTAGSNITITNASGSITIASNGITTGKSIAMAMIFGY
ncbi:hypothetical protein UFOVP306_34 [uncultured Caudovirales phage]|uniref:Uncharacterized protein n=1 Tax=uncultured Caudovirales phage TaxID=2100421 RepID=A0A6J5LXW0_9CAUD|nr:hypothetical protein UFOVP306_34 [uncultured Caudovirales phage]